MDVPINYLAVIVAAIVNMGLGMLWYGPLFGKQWMHMTGHSQESMQGKGAMQAMWRSMLIAFVLAIIMGVTLTHMIVYAEAYNNVSGIMAGLQAGFWTWFGFLLPATAGVYLWEGKPLKLWAIHAGYFLVLLLINGAILGAWM